jgi:hypothetical protein
MKGYEMSLEAGDHVWYWNGNTSLAADIPRAEWFPGSNPHDPTDYGGHGTDIYQYVLVDEAILCGQPQMRVGPGSWAWLNNNPGNLTGVTGGADFGQYLNKFSWHNFLIFPTYELGFDAIALFLRQGPYPPLSIVDAFRKYAPAGDGGNRPDEYAAKVAAEIGVAADTTLIGDLDDDQMLSAQRAIEEMEGSIEGWTYAYDSAELPEEVAALLV